MKLKRHPLFFSTMTTLAFLVGAGLAWHRWGDQWLARTRQLPRDETIGIPGESEVPSTRNSGIDSVPERQSGELRDRLQRSKIPQEVLSQSSWQDPFAKELWAATDCEFAEDRLELTQDGKAAFVRPYRRLRVEFSANRPVAEDSGHSWPAQFELHLLNPTADKSTTLIMTDGEAAIAQRSGDDWSFVRRAPIAALSNGSVGLFRVNATGSRILVWRDNQMLLNCPQPSTEGADLYVQFAARDSDLVISQLRIEGE